VAEPAAPPPVAEPSTDEAIEAATPPGPQKQVSLYMGSPIWLSNAPVDPGFEFEFRSGIKFDMWVPELGIGARWNWINVDKLEEVQPDLVAPERFQGENLSSFWLSLGLRVEPRVKGKIQPYGSVAFDFLLWGLSTDTTDVCGIWTCTTVRNYEFAPGFSGRAGIRFSPKPFIGLDLGAKLGMSFPGWAFQDTHSWIEPYAGFTLITGAKKQR
jgi:hypothetical protein